MNGNQKNAYYRNVQKGPYIPFLTYVMLTFSLHLSDIAEIAGMNYSTLRNGFRDTSRISLDKLEAIKQSLISYIDTNLNKDSRYKAYCIVRDAMENKERE